MRPRVFHGRPLTRAIVWAAVVCATWCMPARAQVAPGTRTVILVRHGAYYDLREGEPARGLTALGREQARLAGERLAKWPVPIDTLYSSTMTRARETAKIIGEALGRTPHALPDVSECTPPVRGDALSHGVPRTARERCAARLERAWSEYFRPTAELDSTEVIVCHANVIRYLVTRAMGGDIRRWNHLYIAHCSITVIQVAPDGRISVLSIGDVGHLPPSIPIDVAARLSAWPPPK